MNIEASNSRNTPTYLAHYDMQRAPFATHFESDMYCDDAALAQRLGLLLHLTQYGNELLLVTAEEGGGKTSMMHQFLNRAQSNWSVGHISATDSSSTQQIVKQIYHQFELQRVESDVQTLGSENASSNEVKKHLESFMMTNRRVVLLVDDADKLSTEVLELLLDLSTIIHHEKSSLQIILFCRPKIKVQLAAPELEQKRFLKQRKIDLPNLTIKQTDNLIQHRLNLTGMKGSKIFPQSSIKRIYKISKGNPNLICEMAHQILTDSTPKERHRFFNLDYILHPHFPKSINAIAISFVVILLAGLIYFQDSVITLYQNETRQKQEAQFILESPQPPNSQQQDSITDTGLEDYHSETDSDDNATTLMTATDNLALIADKPSNRNNPIAVDQTSKPIADSPTRSVKKTKALTAKAPISIKHQTQWLLSQKSDHYTLQILAGYKLSTIENFLRQHSLDADKLAYYLSSNNGKQWHSLVYGIFPDRDTARLAIKTLPTDVTIEKPWIRKLRFIKRDINDHI